MQPDRLLSHSDFVHRLARSLLADAHAAEDVAQETLLEALRHPPASGIGRAWLTTVARNLARKAKRSWTRSARRETRAARPGWVLSTEAILEREEQRRRLVELVLSLDEPYRSTVLLRYFHDLPPRRIARELGVPVETVHSRLKRARHRLRSRLEAVDPSGWGWSAGPLLLGIEPRWSLWRGLRGAVQSLQVQSGALLGVLSLVTTSIWLCVSPGIEEERDPARQRALLSPPLASAHPVVGRLRAATSDRDQEAEAARPEPEIFGRVMDDDRRGVEDAIVTITDEDGESHRIEAFSGWFELEGVAPGRWTVRAEAPWFWPQEQLVEVGEEDPPITELIMKRIRVAVRLEMPDGRLLAPGRGFDAEDLYPEPPREVPSRRGLSDLGVVVSNVRLDSVPELLTRFPSGDVDWRHPLLGESHFYWRHTIFLGARVIPMPRRCSGVLELRSPPPCHVSVLFQRSVLSNLVLARAPIDEDHVVTLVVDPKEIGQRLATVKLRVLDVETGSPVPDVGVFLRGERSRGFPESALADSPRTGVDGSIELKHQLPGLRYLVLLHPEYEAFAPYAHRVRIPPGQAVDLGTIRIAKKTSLGGIVKGAGGEPLEGATVWCERLDRRELPQPLWSDWSQRTDESGRFRIRDQGRGRFLVFATFHEEEDRRQYVFARSRYAINPTIVDNTAGDVDIEVSLRPGTPLSVEAPSLMDRWPAVELVDAQGIPVWFAELEWKNQPSSVRVVPGHYTLRLYDDMTLMETRDLEIGEEPVKIVFE